MLKYIRHSEEGFIVWPKKPGDEGIWHRHMAKVVAGKSGELMSAGFVDFGSDGLPYCSGHSESLGLDSRSDDTTALRKEWGLIG
jgi:hypothetical protein